MKPLSARRESSSSSAGEAALRRVQRAIRLVKPELGPRAMGAEASLVRDLGIDSLKFAELSIALEEEFGRPIFLGDVLADIEDPAKITVGQLARFLEEQ